MTDLRKIDLNLVLVLEALLTERNITRASERVGMSPQTVSAALARLRELFDDALLTRDGRGFLLTPFAESLLPGVTECMDEVRCTFETLPTFDAATSRRTFVVCASDYVISELASPLYTLLAHEAPHTRVEFTSTPVDKDVTTVDLLRHDVTIAGSGRGIPGQSAALFSDWFVCVVDASNPEVRHGELSLDAVRRLRHVRSVFGPHASTLVDDMLRAAGIEPHVAITVEGFASVPFAVSGTDAIGWVPERIALRYADLLGLAVARTPIEPRLLVEAAHWHPSKSEEPSLTWLIAQLRQASEMIDSDRDLPVSAYGAR